jgi:manganese transport protein
MPGIGAPLFARVRRRHTDCVAGEHGDTGGEARWGTKNGDGRSPDTVHAMKRLSGLALGILAAVGGFVDMGGIITSSQAGAQYRFALLWTLIPGIVGFAVYADMSGRVAIASGRTMYDAIRDRLGYRLALIPLLSTAAVNTLTLLVELAGMTLALQVATHLSYLLWFPLATLFLALILWKASFNLLDNSSALLGLAMLVVVVAMFKLAPPWGAVAVAMVHPSLGAVHQVPGYLFAAVSLLGAYMTPYEFAFYSSGAIEDAWDAGDLLTNRAVAIIGTFFGALIVFALTVSAALVLFPQHLPVNHLSDAALPTRTTLGVIGLGLFLLGAFAVSMGAGLETALSGAYSICQYFGWDWGKKGRPREAPMFHLIYLVMLLVAMLLAYTRVDPIQVTVVTLAVAAAALPFTFLPLLIVANDADYMGDQKNTLAINVVAWIVLGLLCAVTLAVLPLLILSGGGGS